MAHNLTPHQASFVLEEAIADRKLTLGDAHRYLASIHQEISTLEQRLARLKGAMAQPISSVPHHGSPGKKAGGDPPFPAREGKRAGKRRRKRVSPERRASMQVQGQYLGLLTATPKKDRTKFQKIAKKDGREKAIAAMKKALGK